MRRAEWSTWAIALAGAAFSCAGCGPANPAASQSAQSAPATSASQAAHEPLDLVPAESLLCWYGRRFPDADSLPSDSSGLWTALQLGPRLAGPALDAQAKLYARMVEAFGLTVHFPHALALIDAQAKPLSSDPSGQRVDRLRFAWVVQAGDQVEAFARVIQSAVNEQTDTQKATLARKQAERWAYQELHDTRLPDWCTIAWGRIGEHFVLTVGPDVWPLVASVAAGKSPALSRSDWLVGVRGERGRRAVIEIIVDAQAIRTRLDPVVDNRATAFFTAWHADDLERAHWALGFEGPALYCVAHFVEHGRVRERVYADPAVREPRLLATVPETARYAIYRIPPAQLFPRLCNGLLATQGQAYRQRVDEVWQELQAQYGFSAERDLLAHLGDYIVLHNFPPHPLRVPAAMTTLTEIRDRPQHVRQTVDAMCRACQELWNRQTEESGTPATVFLERDQDGVWYLMFGPVAGPAWIVTDRFLITSWSPAALRTYLEQVGDRAGQLEK